MSQAYPPGTEHRQNDEGLQDNELLQPRRTCARTRAYHKATTAAGPADHVLYNQDPPNSPPPRPNGHASELSKPATYREAMNSEYSATWVYGTNEELSGLQGAGTFGVA